MINLSIESVRNLYWDKEYDMQEIARELGVSLWQLYGFMRKNNIPRRSSMQVNYISNKGKPQFKVKTDLTIFEEKIKISGIMLYWAEGTFRGTTVDFANSNPEMVKVFLKFLREICGAHEKRLRVYLYAYEYQNIEKLKLYWSDITGIPLAQFTKPYVREGSLNLSQRKLLYGLVHIRYNDKQLLEIIKSWLDNYIKWAGTQAAKGDRLCKRSVPAKVRMEK